MEEAVMSLDSGAMVNNWEWNFTEQSFEVEAMYTASLFVIVILLLNYSLCDIINSCVVSNSLAIPQSEYALAYFKQHNLVYIYGGRYPDGYTNETHKAPATNITSSYVEFKYIEERTPTNTFTTISNNVAVIDNYAYFIGIYNGNFQNFNIYRFDLTTDTFSEKTNDTDSDSYFSPMPIGAVWGCVTTNDTHIFVVGGNWELPHYDKYIALQFERVLNITQIYDIENDEWSIQPFNIYPVNETGITSSQCMMLNNTLYSFGGATQNAVLSSIYKVEWPQNEWTYLGNLSKGVVGGFIVRHCDLILIGGGMYNENGWVTATIHIFDINDEREIEIDHEYLMEVPQALMSAIVVDNDLIIFGGRIDNQPSKITQVCGLDVCDAVGRSEHDYGYWWFIGIGIILIAVVICVYNLKRRSRRRMRLSTDTDLSHIQMEYDLLNSK